MGTAKLNTDWQRSPPALGLALSRGQESLPGVEEADAMWDCVRPALAASTAMHFVQEVRRRLPLFAALHAKQLDQGAVLHAADPASVAQGYAALEAEIVGWGNQLDDIIQAELDLAVVTLRRSNKALLRAAPETGATETADLFRAAVLAEFLLFCLSSLAESGEHPRIADQIVHSLRYAALDYAAAVRNYTSSPSQNTVSSSDPASDEAEDSFWALAGTLPILEAGDPV